jgi:hypothetical protein
MSNMKGITIQMKKLKEINNGRNRLLEQSYYI